MHKGYKTYGLTCNFDHLQVNLWRAKNVLIVRSCPPANPAAFDFKIDSAPVEDETVGGHHTAECFHLSISLKLDLNFSSWHSKYQLSISLNTELFPPAEH